MAHVLYQFPTDYRIVLSRLPDQDGLRLQLWESQDSQIDEVFVDPADLCRLLAS